MFRSAGFRFFLVAFLALVMLIPLLMVSDVVSSRRAYHRDTLQRVGGEWGGPQAISGPALILPVSEEVTETRTRDVVDPATGRVMVHETSGQPVRESYDYTYTATRPAIVLLPGRFDATISTVTETRYRGIFEVPVYQARVGLEFDFPQAEAEKLLTGAEVIDWKGARLLVALRTNRALRGETRLSADGAELALEPREGEEAGLTAGTGDPRGLGAFSLQMEMNGAERLMIAPVGRTSRVGITSDWPHPSFEGEFLPDRREIGAQGFSASWTIPHLARNLPQAMRSEQPGFLLAEAGRREFGFSFYQPNDFYQKAWRASKYGLLIVSLTFLTVFLIEGRRERPVHPVQYILIGLAQAIFVMLMLAYAEQIGFGPAYGLAAGATTLLLTAFGALGLKLGRRALVLGLSLAVLYGVLYLILQSTDYALLAGATLAFLALAATMFATRNEQWYGAPGQGQGPGQGRGLRGLFGKPGGAAKSAPEPAPGTAPEPAPPAPRSPEA